MQSQNIGNISRSSLPALSTTGHETNTDDLAVVNGLLAPQKLQLSKIPRHKDSFIGTPLDLQNVDGMDAKSQVGDELMRSSSKPTSRRAMLSSNTWTSSEREDLTEQDQVNDRTAFISEYNRLARQQGVRLIAAGFEGFSVWLPVPCKTCSLTQPKDDFETTTKRESWFYRKILKKTSSQSVRSKPDSNLRHRRSISDLSLRLRAKKDKLKDKDLQELVILCGSSRLYLPTEYAASSLSVPTCFRATAQYLVQHGAHTRGLFRIPGSHNVVAALYNHYCSLDEYGDVVAGTVRCPTLPDHIRCDVHDVASAFKKFISGLPGGILGSLILFDAFISIQTQLHSDPELTRTKHSKVRARLIALAISTIRSQYRRDLICAVFGLLCMIGRASETTKREDDRGHPLPTSDLMGYAPLGIVFGPLLIGDLLDDYTAHLVDPHGGLVLLPISPPKSRKERRKKITKSGDEGCTFNTHVDKVKVANSITEMLITHWREVVRHLRSLDSAHYTASSQSLGVKGGKSAKLRPSTSDNFMKYPPNWNDMKSESQRLDRSRSPCPVRYTSSGRNTLNPCGGDNNANVESSPPDTNDEQETLSVRKQRMKSRPRSLQRFSSARSLSILSPTLEESSKDNSSDPAVYVGPEEAEPPRAHAGLERKSSQVYTKLSKGSEKENAARLTPRQTADPRLGHKPSEKMQQRIKMIESGMFPRNDAIHSASKEPPKSSEAVNSPPKITWGNRDTGSTTTVNVMHISSSPELQENPATRGNSDSRGVSRQIFQTSAIVHPHQGAITSHSASNSPSSPLKVLKDSFAGVVQENSQQIRRTGGSEPDLQTSSPIRLPRRILQSFQEDYTHTGTRLEIVTNLTDPLFKFSQTEDVSLSKVPEKTPFSGDSKKKGAKNSFERALRVVEQSTASSSPSGGSKKPSDPAVPTENFPSFAIPSTHGAQSTQTSTRQVSDLIARFNHERTESELAGHPPIRRKRSQKLAEKDISDGLRNSKEKVVAPYTTNPSSPRKSPVSVNSLKTPKPIRSTRLMAPSTAAEHSPIHNSPPRRALRGSIVDSTPLRSVKDILGKKESPSVNSSNPFSVSLKSVQGTNLGNHLESKEQSILNQNSSDTTYASIAKSSADGSSRNTKTDQNSSTVEGQFVSSMDGAFNPTSFGRVLPSPEPPPVALHVHFSRPQASSNDNADVVGSSSPLVNNLTASEGLNRSGTPTPSRSNSVLYDQVRNLRRQLAEKTGEIRQLKQQLSARQNLEIGTLSEQLREAKRATEIWKTRATNYEKQLLMFDRACRHSISRHSVKEQCTPQKEPLRRSGPDYSPSNTIPIEGAPRSLRGLDGARSTLGWNSDESCDTVIREIQEHAIIGSEYSNWAEQAMNALEYMTPED